MNEARVVRIPVAVTRRADALVDDPTTPYRTFSDLVEVALRNQMEIDLPEQGGIAVLSYATDPGSGVLTPTVPIESESISQVLSLPNLDRARIKVGYPPSEARPGADRRALTFLTNRLNPVPVVVRILATIGPADIGEVRAPLVMAARQIGFRLKQDDAAANRSMAERRATSWPTGSDPEKSGSKFLASYLVDDQGRGALADLGLAELVDGRIVLTDAGLELAALPCPILGEGDSGAVVGDEAVDLLRSCLLANPSECSVLSTFLHAIHEHDGNQGMVDQVLMDAFGWNPAVTASHRAALSGRLRDLRVLAVVGRGTEARLVVLKSEMSFIAQVDDSRTHAEQRKSGR